MNILVHALSYFLIINAVTWIVTIIENQFRIISPEKPCEVYDRRSLRVFKMLRTFSTLFAVFEVTILRTHVSHNEQLLWSSFGVVLFLTGFTLRILAIKRLGHFWSFHVVRYSDQPLIKSGIYRHLSQPAYLGNIYLPGIYLVFGAYTIAALATIWLIAFGVYRMQIEKVNNLC